MKSQQVAGPRNLNLKTICLECMFLVTAPRLTMHTLLLWAQSILSFTIFLPQTSFHSEKHLLSLRVCSAQPPHVQCSTWSTYLKCCCQASEVSVAFSPLGGYGGTEGMGKRTSGVLHYPPYLFLQLASVPANTNWEPILASEQEQKLLSKTKGALSAGEHGTQTYEPQDWTTLLGQPNFFNH